jgi:hypothetical protein
VGANYWSVEVVAGFTSSYKKSCCKSGVHQCGVYPMSAIALGRCIGGTVGWDMGGMAAKDIAPLTVALVKTASGQQQAFSEPLLNRGYSC